MCDPVAQYLAGGLLGCIMWNDLYCFLNVFDLCIVFSNLLNTFVTRMLSYLNSLLLVDIHSYWTVLYPLTFVWCMSISVSPLLTYLRLVLKWMISGNYLSICIQMTVTPWSHSLLQPCHIELLKNYHFTLTTNSLNQKSYNLGWIGIKCFLNMVDWHAIQMMYDSTTADLWAFEAILGGKKFQLSRKIVEKRVESSTKWMQLPPLFWIICELSVVWVQLCDLTTICSQFVVNWRGKYIAINGETHQAHETLQQP